jgi:hypothetical protein
MRRPLRTGLVVLLALASATPSRALTKIEGEYQLMVESRKNNRAYPWDFDSNSYDNFNNAQLRIFSQPRTGVETFFKLDSDWHPNDNNGSRPEFQFREAHIRMRREFGKRGVDAYLFSRQDRFWVDSYLINFVGGRGDAQGIRLDTWGFGGSNLSLVVADQSSQFNPADFSGNDPVVPRDSLAGVRERRTDDLYVLRLRREFLKDQKLRLGFTFNRFEGWTGRDSLSGPQQWTSVFGFDSRLRLGKTDVSVEYGESRPTLETGNGRSGAVTIGKRPTPLHLSDRSVLQAEIRSLRVGSPRTGFLNVTPGWWSRGPRWRNSIGGPNADETGFILQSYYLLPERAITYSNQFSAYGNKVFSRNSTREMYNELYIEFVNGFTGKTAYRRRDSYSPNGGVLRKDTRLEWFNEVQVESRLAWLRVQSKLRDIGKPERKQLFSIENSLNLTAHTKVYNRFVFGNDASILRKGLFTQLQYRPTGNMELFVQYGPDYIGGGSTPVDEGNLNGNGDQFDQFKIILKGNF